MRRRSRSSAGVTTFASLRDAEVDDLIEESASSSGGSAIYVTAPWEAEETIAAYFDMTPWPKGDGGDS